MNLSQIQICEDDATIKALLIQHGKLAHVEARQGFSPYRYHITWSDAESVYTVTHYHGYSIPSDNGYVAIMMPRSCGTSEEIVEIINLLRDEGRTSGPYYSEIVEDCAEAN